MILFLCYNFNPEIKSTSKLPEKKVIDPPSFVVSWQSSQYEGSLQNITNLKCPRNHIQDSLSGGGGGTGSPTPPPPPPTAVSRIVVRPKMVKTHPGVSIYEQKWGDFDVKFAKFPIFKVILRKFHRKRWETV